MIEKWKIVEGFENYEVSDQGKVRRATTGKRTFIGRLLKVGIGTGGYLQVCLYKDKKAFFKSLHTLVAKAFIPNPLDLPEVNHKGTKSDCRAAMLEWRSKRGNEIDKVQKNRQGIGISFDKQKNKWRAYFHPKPYKREWLGRFQTKEEALIARNKAVQSLPNIL
jgi:hypothetical protein